MATLIEYVPEKAYPYAQGFCITGRYIFICNILDNAHEVVCQYDKFTLKQKRRIEFTGLIRHGNDFAWNCRENQVYCAAGGGSKEIIVFDEQMNYLWTVRVPFDDIVSLSGVAYDPVSGLTAIYGGDSHKVFIVEKITDRKPLLEFKHSASSNFQGLAFYDHVVYGVYSSGKIRIMNMDGETIKLGKVATTGETENVKIYNGKVFYNVQAKPSGLYYTDLTSVIKNAMID